MEHQYTHLPYRSWCEPCVKDKGLQLPHKQSSELPHQHELHWDFAYIGQEGKPGQLITIFVMRERLTKMILTTPVPTNGINNFISNFKASDIDQFARNCVFVNDGSSKYKSQDISAATKPLNA